METINSAPCLTVQTHPLFIITIIIVGCGIEFISYSYFVSPSASTDTMDL